MRKSSLLFTASLKPGFSAKLKVSEIVLFETTYGSPGEGWETGIVFTSSSQVTAIFNSAAPRPSRSATPGLKPDQ